MPDFSTPLPTHSQNEITSACQGLLHPQAVIGIRLFNRGDFFESHEALESAWMDEKGAIRDVYRGILQAAVAYLHIQRNNYRGARKMLARSQEWLAPFPQKCRGIDLDNLRADIQAVEQTVTRLGPEQLRWFDQTSFKPIKLETPNL